MLIAKGVYQHFDNGIANGVSETWELSQESDAYQMKVEFRAIYALTATILFSGNWHVTDFSYRTDDGLNGHYRVRGQKLLVDRVLAANTRLDDTLVWSAEAILDLPFLSCKGHTILHLHKNGTVPTFAPILHSGDRAGDLAKKSVTRGDNLTLSVNDRLIETTHYRYVRDYWLDDYGIVIEARDKTYEMILTEYQR